MTRVRFEAVPYGLGPLGKALHLAAALRLRAPHLTLDLVTSPQFIPAVSPDSFASIYTDDDQPPQADLVVSVMKSVGAQRAVSRGERTIFIDSLAWLWDKPLAVPPQVERYFYQDLPMLPPELPNVAPHGARAIPVGPIVGPTTRNEIPSRPTRHDLLLSLGGIDNFEVSVEHGTAHYHQVIAREFMASTSVRANHTIVFGNPAALQAFEGVRRGSGAQAAFLGEAASAQTVAVSPGLTSILELVSRDLRFGLLPPQNYSQARIAHRMRQFVPTANWVGSVLPWLGDAVMPEAVGSQIMRSLISDNYLNPRGIEGLDEVLRSDHRPRNDSLRRALAVDEDGASTIVDWIVNAL